MKNIVVIVSGGSGVRMKHPDGLPKPYIKIANKMIIEHTINVFHENNNIDEIAIVLKPAYYDLINSVLKENNFFKVKMLLPSGETRNDSSWSAISAYNSIYNECKLLIHDAVRPFITSHIIDECILALDKYNAVCVAEKMKDTIIEKVDNDNYIKNIPNRDVFLKSQTPQGFKLKTIHEAYTLFRQDKIAKVSDDCGVVKAYLPNESIYIIDGEVSNIKITFQEDLLQADLLFNKRNSNLK